MKKKKQTITAYRGNAIERMDGLPSAVPGRRWTSVLCELGMAIVEDKEE